MPSLDAKMATVAEQVLQRQLTEDEQLHIYRISDALGMTNVQSFLYQLLVFKLHEDTLRDALRQQFEDLRSFEGRLNEKIEGIGELETQVNETLTSSVDRVLGEGAKRIGADMGEEIASQAKTAFAGIGAYYLVKGKIAVACIVCLIAAVSYFLGQNDALSLTPNGGPLQALMYLPAGWCFVFCGMVYTFLWVGDNWNKIRKKILFKALLAVQIFVLLAFVLAML